METVEMQNIKGTRKFNIWGGVAVRTNADGSEYHKELNACDLFTGTIQDNLKAIAGVGMLDVRRGHITSDDNGAVIYVSLYNENARYDYIELKGWEV